jgi:hypothetical protein
MPDYRMPRTSVTLSYDDRCYAFALDREEAVKGKLSCDCRKSWLIREYCDASFPALECGHNIVILAVVDLDAEKKIAP